LEATQQDFLFPMYKGPQGNPEFIKAHLFGSFAARFEVFDKGEILNKVEKIKTMKSYKLLEVWKQNI
jgi:hypothetical protein